MSRRIGSSKRIERIGRVFRGAMASATLVLVGAGPALARMSKTSLEGAENAVGPHMPEPGAAILFALGAGAVAWGVRRHHRRS